MDLINNTELERLSTEKSVRGAVVRKALERHAQAEPEQRAVVEKALKLLLDRFEGDREETT